MTMERIYHFLRKMKTFLIKEEQKYSVYVINGVIWYRLEKKSPEIRFHEVMKWIMKKCGELR